MCTGSSDQRLANRIDGDAAPVEDAEVGRIRQRLVRRRRRVRALVVHRLELDPADELIERRRAPHVLAGERRRHEAERRGGLRRRDVLVGQRARRHRDLADRQDRLAGAPVEHVDVALLGRLHERRHLGAADLEIDRASAGPACRDPRGRGERPGTTSAACRSRGRARRPSSRIARPPALRFGAELVGRLVAERKVDDAELLVDARRCPRRRRVGGVRLAGREAERSGRSCRGPSSRPGGRR